MKKNVVIEFQNQPVVCCVPLNGPTLNRQEAAEAAHLFAALADPTRVCILNLLVQAQGGEVCVCDITDSFTLGQPTISHHLRILREAGLITGDKRGKWVYYSLVAERVAQVREMLEKVLGSPVPALSF